ncbi:MAG: hypothetical protein J0H67_07480 [Rhodospirillales bacterium]|nr:hypothetical protein [Rhodospirillales bacterium]
MNRQQRRAAARQGGCAWTPLVEVPRSQLAIELDPAEVAQRYGCTAAEARHAAAETFAGARVFTNRHLHVTLKPAPQAGWVHLAIRRHDGCPDVSWSDKQKAKNEVVGPDHEAIELFPAEDRLLDMGHVYHLWVQADPGERLELGWHAGRNVACEIPTSTER